MSAASRRQQWIALVASLGVIAAILGITGWRPPRAAGDPALVALYGEAGLALLADAPQWEAWLLHAGPPGMAGTFQGVPVREGALNVHREGFRGLLALLQDPRTFGEPADPCGQPPLAGLRFTDGEETLDLLLCFECDVLQACRPEGRQRRRFNHAALLPHVKRIWPRDPVIQALR